MVGGLSMFFFVYDINGNYDNSSFHIILHFRTLSTSPPFVLFAVEVEKSKDMQH